VRTFAASDADLITAITMTYGDEAIGLSEAARAAAMPVVTTARNMPRRPRRHVAVT
jgi:hypothetical protein